VIGLAVREILLEAGCRSLSLMATVKECPEIRTDGVYTEVANPRDIPLMLQTRPNAIGILPAGDPGSLAIIPIGGIPASWEAISNSTYPGSRPLYLYVSGAAWTQPSSYISSTLWFTAFEVRQRFAIIVPNGNKP